MCKFFRPRCALIYSGEQLHLHFSVRDLGGFIKNGRRPQRLLTRRRAFRSPWEGTKNENRWPDSTVLNPWESSKAPNQ